ncbi:MAG: HD domain-containing protein [Gammaproteobacteria bacterium]|nr:HD domain-containing protein [Gammaproteobacteria bacterium]
MSETKNQVEDSHYVAHVKKAGSTHDISTNEDIISESGHKLIAKNVTLSGDMYEKLMQHKLLKPLDMSISVGGRLDSNTLQEEFETIFRSEPLCKAILQHAENANLIKASLKNIKLPEAIAGKMTVMRSSMPEMFRHSLITALLASYSGTLCGFNDKECIVLATAGLLHDMGNMHVDPLIFAKRERLDLPNLKQFYAHPIIAFMIMQNFAEFKPLISAAVVEHHERMDGSGYPHQLQADMLSPYGQLLSILEVFVSVYTRSNSLKQALTVMRTNMRHFPAKLLAPVVTALNNLSINEPRADIGHLKQNIVQKLVLITQAITAWQQPFLMVSDKDAAKSPASLTTLHLDHIKISMIRCGLINHHLENVTKLNIENMLANNFDNELEYLVEMSTLVDDHVYQLVELIRNLLRRWPIIDKDIKTDKDTPLINWISFVDQMLGKLPHNMFCVR